MTAIGRAADADSCDASSSAKTNVSVVIPAYERIETLHRAIASVQGQPGIAVEIVVVDDGSPHPIKLTGIEGANVRLVRSAINGGAGPARNLGATHASHDVLAFLDADDEWLPGSARARVRLVERGACVVGSYLILNDITGLSRTQLLPRDVSSALRFGNPAHPSGLMISRADFERAGGFPHDRSCAEDWVFLLRARRANIDIRSVTRPVAVVHVDAANTTLSPETSAEHALGAIRYIEAECLLSFQELVRTKRAVHARVAGFYANAGRGRACATHLRAALPGVAYRSVAREFFSVPKQALRGLLRRWLVVDRQDRSSAPLPQANPAEITVVASDPTEAWVALTIERLREATPDIRIVKLEEKVRGRLGALSRWRIRHAGEPNAEEMVCIFGPGAARAPTAEMRRLSPGFIIDLCGKEAYRPNTASDPPVVRVRFGSAGWLRAEDAFDDAHLLGRRLDKVWVTLESNAGSAILCGAPVVVDLTSRSLTWNAAMWKAAEEVPRAVMSLLAGRSHLKSAPKNYARLRGQRQVARALGLARLVRSAPERLLTRDRWGVAIQPLERCIPSTETLAQRHSVWVEDDHSLADPHLFAFGDATYLFVERIRPGRPGAIAVGRVDASGSVEGLEDVLTGAVHLSYPMVFEEHGELWLLPETSSNQNIRLFCADDFPHTWSPATTLLRDIVAFDPTLHHNEDGYWLWACVSSFGRGRNDVLCLFHSRSLHGPWRSHPANPIVDDPGRARPAGSLFFAEGRLVRPSQDCSAGYGRRIVLNEVLELDTRRYRERPVALIEPEWAAGLVATHTISRSRAWQAIDGARRVFDPISSRAAAHL